jgi:hypothetical protein
MTLSAVVAATLAVVAPGPAHAATLKAPTGLSPTGPTASSTPTFSWTRVAAAPP